MTIRISEKTLSAIDMVIAELRVKQGGRVTQDAAIWELVKIGKPEIAERVETLVADTQKQKE